MSHCCANDAAAPTDADDDAIGAPPFRCPCFDRAGGALVKPVPPLVVGPIALLPPTPTAVPGAVFFSATLQRPPAARTQAVLCRWLC
ncbi:MAG: hypothetical protein QM775_34940 [Pirellulales bacterium]